MTDEVYVSPEIRVFAYIDEDDVGLVNAKVLRGERIYLLKPKVFSMGPIDEVYIDTVVRLFVFALVWFESGRYYAKQCVASNSFILLGNTVYRLD